MASGQVLHSLFMSHKKDARLIWVNYIITTCCLVLGVNPIFLQHSVCFGVHLNSGKILHKYMLGRVVAKHQPNMKQISFEFAKTSFK